jgi:mRNA interferase RelE/StbE
VTWGQEFKPSAAKALKKLERSIQERVMAALTLLVSEMNEHGRPVRSDVMKMGGKTDLWRLKIHDWRILFTYEDGRLVIVVVEVGNRKDVYKSK